MKGWSMKSSLEKNPGSPRAGLQQQQPPSRSGATEPVRAPDPCTKRTRGLVELGTSLFYTYKSSRSLQKSGETDRQRRRCPARVPQLREERIHNFTSFFPKKLVPDPAGAEGPGSSSCTQPEGTAGQGKGLRAAGRGSPTAGTSACGHGRAQHGCSQPGHRKIEKKGAWSSPGSTARPCPQPSGVQVSPNRHGATHGCPAWLLA